MSVEPLFGWVCPLCRSVYPTKGEAENCIESHIEYIIEKNMVLSDPYPINITVWKEVAGKRVEWKDYKPESEIHKVRNVDG